MRENFGGVLQKPSFERADQAKEKVGELTTAEDVKKMKELYEEDTKRREGGLDAIRKPKRMYFYPLSEDRSRPFGETTQYEAKEEMYSWRPGEKAFNGGKVGVHEFVKIQEDMKISEDELEELEELRVAVRNKQAQADFRLPSGELVRVQYFRFAAVNAVECQIALRKDFNKVGSHESPRGSMSLIVPARQFYDWQSKER
ncbi:MAG TPA: hypothetical protein VMU11_02555 [Verrucomicrobiae bacterium]|nr:hypothetical protein [Verrucomicrobiae bacterium]